MIVRSAAAVTLAAIVTLALLYSMQMLISTGTAAILEPEKRQRVDLLALEPPERAEAPRVKPERPSRPAKRPAATQTDPALDTSVQLAAAVTVPRFLPGARASAGPSIVGDADYVPINRMLHYPAQAIARDLEGYVVLEYTVTARGKVSDINVVESSAPLFEASAIKAALGFEYRPRVVGGEAVDVTGVVNKIVFRIQAPRQLAMQR